MPHAKPIKPTMLLLYYLSISPSFRMCNASRPWRPGKTDVMKRWVVTDVHIKSLTLVTMGSAKKNENKPKTFSAVAVQLKS